jgi:hypothetical protein
MQSAIIHLSGGHGSRGNKMKNIILFIFLVLFSCDIAFIPDTSGIDTFPSKRNQVITVTDRISISFNFDVNKVSAENTFRITSVAGSVNGFREWEGNTMYFTPQPVLSYGQRYVLSCSGEVKDTENHEYPLNIEIPFFYLTSQTELPVVLSVYPSEGCHVPVTENIVISFSNPINPWSFKEGFSLSPATDFQILWNEDSMTAEISPDEEWDNLTAYAITLKQNIEDINGLSIAEEINTTFFTESDTDNPGVISIWPSETDWETAPPFLPLFVPMEEIENGNSIRIDFTEEMDPESVKNAFSITPDLNGTKVFIDRNLYPDTVENSYFVYIPKNNFLPETEYTVILNNTAEDIYRNTLLTDYVFRFTTDNGIPSLLLESIHYLNDLGTEHALSDYSSETALEITPNNFEQYHFCFYFSEEFSDSDKISVQEKIDVKLLFPDNAASPHAYSFSWTGNDTLNISFTNFEHRNNPAGVEYFYMLEIKGGPQGIINSEGCYLKEDIYQLLTTEEQP